MDDETDGSDADLDRYRAKRDFEQTSEPAGGTPSAGGHSFVVQKHAASRLHYDVRIEVDGVMPSWAVPKGPSYDPKVKRLAMHVEDHPLDYQTFEGIIPKGQYGGGTVIVWDRGTYRNITERNGEPVHMRDAIEKGHVSIWFDGEKLHGGWSLTRTQDDAWIMVKRKDDHANSELDVTTREPRSVVSQRTVEEVAASLDEPEWTRGTAVWVKPMLAQSSTGIGVPSGEWTFERKLDGLRCIAVRNGDDVQLWSRNHLSFNVRFPHIVDALRSLPVDNFTLDGELVAFHRGRTSFTVLQRGEGQEVPQFHVFDVLHLLGNDTTSLPLEQRRELVARFVETNEVLCRLELLDGEVDELMQRARGEGWEGLIAKRMGSIYVNGRSPLWKKIKCDSSQEMVIGGWTDPRRSRTSFGALLLGYYDESGFRYAGKVGSGFGHETLETLHRKMRDLEMSERPFVDQVKEPNSHWVKPELVASIKFAEWTPDGKLRHARFEGLRSDKDPQTVVRESS